MKTFELKGELRKATGKTSSRKTRNEGKTPCVLYGGKETVHFSTETASLQKLIYTPNVYLVNLEIEGKKHHAIVKDLQFHVVSDKISHLDFLEISDGKPIEINIPVELTGVAPGVKAGGKLHLVNRKLKVKGLPKNFPDTLIVDISNLDLGKSIKVGDLNFENIHILNAKNTVVASVKLTRASKGDATAAEGEGEAKVTEEKKAE
jgi:large subunit ribosomal protein L25